MGSVIEKEGVMPLLLEACPSFANFWDGPYVVDGEHLLYVDLGDLASHLVELLRKGDTEEFEAIFTAIERLRLHGDKYVRTAAAIGLLEGIQNVAGWREVEDKMRLQNLSCLSCKSRLHAGGDG